MVPKLFEPSATSFTSNGVGRLNDCQSCKVVEELNGQYELEMTYPRESRLFKELKYSSIIVAKPFQNGNLQPFRIYKMSKVAKGLSTIYARHISYQLNYIPCTGFSGQTAKQVMTNIKTATVENCPFDFDTNLIGTRESNSRNLYGLDDIQHGIINAHLDANGRLVENDNALSVWMKCQNNRRYLISKIAGKCFAVGSMTQIPSEGKLTSNYVSRPTDRRMEYITPANAQYLVVYIWNKNLDGAEAEEPMFNSVAIKYVGAFSWMLYEPKCIRNFLLGESDDSIQAIYGGEFEWDNYSVYLHDQRGSDKGVKIRYGKNLLDLTQEENIENTITGIYPIWKSDSGYVELPEKVVHAANANKFPFLRTVIQDFSSDFDQEPSVVELREKAKLFIQKEDIGIPEVSLTVNFVNLSDTMEYSNIEELQTVNMGDIVTVEFPDLDVNVKQEVVKTEYDVLNERYTSITIGKIPKTGVTALEDQLESLSSMVTTDELDKTKSGIQNNIDNAKATVRDELASKFQEMGTYVDKATGLLGEGRRGHIVISRNSSGYPNEIYFLDNENIALAQKVLRINMNGIGFSSTGYRGPYYQAWTIDGTLSLGGINNSYGKLLLRDNNGMVIGEWNNNGINVGQGTLAGVRITGSEFISKNRAFYVQENGDRVEVGWSGWDVWNNCMKSQYVGWRSNGSTNPATDDSSSAAINGGCDQDDAGSNGYPGTAGFKALWLDDEWFEGGSSPWSYDGNGSGSHHLWDVAETLQWLDSRLTVVENSCMSYNASSGGGGGGGCPNYSNNDNMSGNGQVACDIEGTCPGFGSGSCGPESACGSGYEANYGDDSGSSSGGSGSGSGSGGDSGCEYGPGYA